MFISISWADDGWAGRRDKPPFFRSGDNMEFPVKDIATWPI